MNNIYSTPDSGLTSRYKKDFDFSNLGIWRKLYLVINWLFMGIIVAIAILGMFNSQHSISGIIIFQIIIIFLFGFLFGMYTYWIHVAVSRRNTTQLLILLFIQIIPFLNPISALILFFIRRTSLKELAEA